MGITMVSGEKACELMHRPWPFRRNHINENSKMMEILNLDEINRRPMVILLTREMLTKAHQVIVNEMRK